MQAIAFGAADVEILCASKVTAVSAGRVQRHRGRIPTSGSTPRQTTPRARLPPTRTGPPLSRTGACRSRRPSSGQCSPSPYSAAASARTRSRRARRNDLRISLLGVKTGQLGGGRVKRHGTTDVATLQTLARRDNVADLTAKYGLIVVDECHHDSANFPTTAPRQRCGCRRPGEQRSQSHKFGS